MADEVTGLDLAFLGWCIGSVPVALIAGGVCRGRTDAQMPPAPSNVTIHPRHYDDVA